jgi:hypothetical protein
VLRFGELGDDGPRRRFTETVAGFGLAFASHSMCDGKTVLLSNASFKSVLLDVARVQELARLHWLDSLTHRAPRLTSKLKSMSRKILLQRSKSITAHNFSPLDDAPSLLSFERSFVFVTLVL